MYKIPVIIREDYTVFLEPGQGCVMVHCDIKTKWSRSVKSALLSDWQTLQELHSHKPMCALHEDHQGNKHIKFLKQMGFTYLTQLTPSRELWVINKLEE